MAASFGEGDGTDAQFDSRQFRTVLGNFCTGIAVVTSADARGPVGFTCQTFSSLSLDPPLVSIAPSRTSTSWPRIRRTGRFCANMLAADQEAVCRAFAASGTDKFAGLGWRVLSSGSPVLNGVVAWVDAELVDEVPAGDHTIAIARVVDLAVERDADPLLFFRGRYAQLAPVPTTV